MVDVFISYKSERRKAAAHLAKILECYGYSVWYDYSLIKGRDFAQQIDAKIREAKAVIVLWCSLSVRSEWVADEAALAAKLDLLVPAKIEPCELRVDFDRKDYLDLTLWGGAPRDHALDALLAALKQKTGRKPQQNFEAICEYEEVWRRFGAPSLKAFALGAPAYADVEPGPPPDPAPFQHSAERDWEHYFAPRSRRDSRVLTGTLIAAVVGILVWKFLPDGGQGGRAAAPPTPAAQRAEVAPQGPAPAIPPETPKEAQTALVEAPRPIRAAPATAREKPERKQTAFVAPPKPAPAPAEEACDGLLVSVAMSGEKPCIKPGSGESFKDCPDCPEMVIAPSGSFTMGSPKDEPERSDDEGPQHKVTIAKPFAVGKFAVTFTEWDACVAAGGCGGYKPSDSGWGQNDRPVINVSWDDAKAYVSWLSTKTGKTYRLLSEAEREYVTRAGRRTPFWWGSSITPDLGNYDGNYTYAGGQKGEYRAKTMPVQSFKPNPWGLYQVHGNVWEWVEDCWNDAYAGAPTDGTAWTTLACTSRVLRGGSWVDVPQFLRAAYRNWYLPDIRSSDVGFRVART